ncbi:hypothetical protein O0L34_g17073 [Tuta absoluta]|nr:hypothetical protein O0L34_g17073 [Tuta absoluta]
MKDEFNEKLNKLMQRKKSNSINFMSRDRYEQFLQEIWELKNKRYKDFEDYKMLSSYDVLELNGKVRLITPKDDNGAVKFYIATDELFGVLHTMHLLFDHAKKEVMEREIKTKYFKFMTSQDGEKLIEFGDFTFTKALGDVVEGKSYWICHTHRGCPAKLFTEHNKLIYAKNHHNHPPTEFFV